MSDAFASFLDGLEKESGGSPLPKKLFCMVTMGFGYKLYVKGMGNEESFFPFVYGDESSKKAAHQLAEEKYTEKMGAAPERLQPALCFRVPQTKCFNLDALEWQFDKMFFSPLWTKTYKDLIKPSIINSGIQPGDSWAELDVVSEIDKDGNQTRNKTVVVARLFKSEAECKAAYETWAASAQNETETASMPTEAPACPPGWAPASWKGIEPTIRGEFASGKSIAAIAKDYAIDESFLTNMFK